MISTSEMELSTLREIAADLKTGGPTLEATRAELTRVSRGEKTNLPRMTKVLELLALNSLGFSPEGAALIVQCLHEKPE